VVVGLFVFYELRGALWKAHELTQELLTLAQEQHETVFLLRACSCSGQTFYYLGDLAAARATFEQGIAVYDPQQHSPQVLGVWQDSGVTCLSYVAWVLWLQGYPEQAKARSHHALSLSDTLVHPYTKMYAAYNAVHLYQFLRDIPQVHEHVQKVRTLATEHGLTQFVAPITMLQGWALVAQGQAMEGLAQLHEGLDAFRARGTELILPLLLARLAEAYPLQGRGEEGLTVLTEALALMDKNDERWWEAELHRLKGELLLLQTVPDAPQAECCFQRALAVARHQQAKSLELRTAMSLSRLWQRQGKRTEAHTLLAEVYGWFTEGFDTADLKDAKALLEELRSM
jgi:predicted ATPase